MDANQISYSLITGLDPLTQALPWLVALDSPEQQALHFQTFATLLYSTAERENVCLLEAFHSGQRVGMMLAQRLSGRAALVWPPRANNSFIALELLRRMLRQLRAEQVCVAQAILEPHTIDAPSSHPGAAELFTNAGFALAGNMSYMVAEVTPSGQPSQSNNLTFGVVDPSDPRLAATIAATYQGTLDCPIVDSWRALSDVIDGYRSTGRFRAELWQLASREQQIVGCLLLADHPQEQQGEIVYLGVLPAFRGRRYGTMLSREAIRLAHARGWQRLLLAVDEANIPALAIYCEVGFQTLLRRRIFVCRL